VRYRGIRTGHEARGVGREGGQPTDAESVPALRDGLQGAASAHAVVMTFITHDFSRGWWTTAVQGPK